MNDFLFHKFFNINDFKHKDIFNDSNNIWEVLTLLDEFINKQPLGVINVSIPKGAFLIEPEKISIGKGTIIESGAYIKGPCIIGEDCQVRHGAYIRGNVITGSGCVIGHASEVKNSIFLNNVSAAHFAYVGDSIIGNNVNLGAGVRLANLRLDRAIISFSHLEKIICTNLTKFGAIIGDNSQIGCNAVLNPATFLGKDSFCYACINISGYFPDHSIIKSASKILSQRRKDSR